MGVTVGFAMTGSFCTLGNAVGQLEKLVSLGYEIVPVMSQAVYTTDTRFGTAQSFRERVVRACGREIIHTVSAAEPIGPKKLLDLLIIAPASGNTIGKLANGVNDTSVTMAAKAHLRNGRPVLLAVATNDALSASAQNIGRLLNVKKFYFVPMRQDNPGKKPSSVVADYSLIPQAVAAALKGEQMEPVLI